MSAPRTDRRTGALSSDKFHERCLARIPNVYGVFPESPVAVYVVFAVEPIQTPSR